MRLFKYFLSFAMIYGSWVQAAPENAAREWNSLVAQRVADRLARGKNFSEFFSDLKIRPRANDSQWLRQLDQKAKSWPKLAVGHGTIEVTDGQAKIRIGIKDLERHELTINGLLFKYDSKRDLRPQLHELFSKQASRDSRPSFFARVMSWILPQAQAIGPLGAVGLMEMASGDVAQGSLNLALDSALSAGEGGGAAAAGAGITVTAGGVAAVAGIVLALAAVGYVGLCYADSGEGWDDHYSSDKFKNCLTAPLSLLGLNWRDKVYPSHISCPGPGHTYFEIEYASKTGIHRTDDFVIDAKGLDWYVSRVENPNWKSVETRLNYYDGKLKRVTITNHSLDDTSVQKLDNSSGAKMKPFEKIGESTHYFMEICKDPGRVAAVNNLLEKGAQVPADKLQILDKAGAVK